MNTKEGQLAEITKEVQPRDCQNEGSDWHLPALKLEILPIISMTRSMYLCTYQAIFAIWFIGFYLEIHGIKDRKHIQCYVQKIRQVEVIPPHLQSECLSEYVQLSLSSKYTKFKSQTSFRRPSEIQTIKTYLVMSFLLWLS